MQISKKSEKKISPEELVEAQLLLQEAIELIEESRQILHQKLDEFEDALQHAPTEIEKKAIEKQANTLYEEYKKTLAELESCIDEINDIYNIN